MSKKLSMKFALVTDNFGDMLNMIIPRDLFGIDIQHTNNYYTARTTGIGSYLDSYFWNESRLCGLPFTRKAVMNAANILFPPTQIWSTGFISYPAGKEVSLRGEQINISSVRGELSKKRIESILGRSLNISTGDGGLLVRKLIPKQEKKYELGIIPHLRETGEGIYTKIAAKFPKAKMIDVREDPYKVLKNIDSCEYILSSSLHGLICSDSFGIPNMRIVTSQNLLGDGFKFDDYYSSFGIESNRIKVDTPDNLPTINQIIDSYSMDNGQAERKMEEITEAFYKFI